MPEQVTPSASLRSGMRGFRWQALDSRGQRQRGLWQAGSATELRTRLLRKGMHHTRIQPAPFWVAGRASPAALARFTRQLATMHKFDAASTKGVIVVNHYLESVWRCFRATDLELGLPSWDLRPFPTFPSAELALSAYL